MIARSKYAKGKLLLTGEYLVMSGATALAVPLKLGQYLSWKKIKEQHLIWNAMIPDGTWFQAQFSLPDLKPINNTNDTLADKLLEILMKVRKLNNDFLCEDSGVEVQTILEFDPAYGFGSSSTLISNLAFWADVDPYELLDMTFGGSGYDIACARSKSPLLFTRKDGEVVVEQSVFAPLFNENILFVYLGKKQVSKDSISSFKKTAKFSEEDIQHITRITLEIERATDLAYFEQLINQHEDIMSTILKLPKVKDLHFSDHQGAVKSLGAWGGDFVMMTFNKPLEEVTDYLKHKGYNIFYTYNELVKS